MSEKRHIPVLQKEVLEYLDRNHNETFVDCTVGLGGHSKAILEYFPNSKIIGLDLDEKSLIEAKENLKSFQDRVTLIHSDFRYLPDLKIDFNKISGILIDLGISSFQLDSPERGFSHSIEGPLDMRMDLRNKHSAYKVINKSSENQLYKIFFNYGELHQAKKIAREIASRKKIKKIETTTQLRRIVEEICKWRPQKGRIHPAAKVFQAIRIEVNQELKNLDNFITKTTYKLQEGSRIVAISFHSLEDRIVKKTFRKLASSEESIPSLKILTKKPIIPSASEIALNSRSRSAKLRAAVRIR